MVYVEVNLEGVCLWRVTFVGHVVISHPHIPSPCFHYNPIVTSLMIDTIHHDDDTGCFFNRYPPKKLKYGKPRLGVSTLT